MSFTPFKIVLVTLTCIGIFHQSSLVGMENDAQCYRCIVRASSHFGFYTFRINPKRCEVYWKEIDTQMNVTKCELPIIEALKPSAQDKYSVVWFNIETGNFYDYLSGVKDRGKCTLLDGEPDENTPIIPPKRSKLRAIQNHSN